jgi:hypothetical protein
MAFQCDQCRRSFKDQPQISISGRRLCDSCNDVLLGATAGAITGGRPRRHLHCRVVLETKEDGPESIRSA